MTITSDTAIRTAAAAMGYRVFAHGAGSFWIFNKAELFEVYACMIEIDSEPVDRFSAVGPASPDYDTAREAIEVAAKKAREYMARAVAGAG